MITILGLALIHFLWQGAVLCALLFVFLLFARDARVRYGSALIVLALMACCPVVTLLYLQQPAPIVGISSFSAGALPLAATASLHHAVPVPPFDWLSAFVVAWCAGVLFFAARAFGGWVILQKLRRNALETVSPGIVEQCRRLQRRIGITKTIRFADSSLASTPAVLGWLRPIVLLPLSAMAGLSSEQFEAVIAHELAHIKRYDALVNFFQIALETLLFYHPAVWWVNHVIRSERESCCDDIAVSVCGNAHEYASALTVLASHTVRPAWAMLATGGSLKDRVARLLGARSVPYGLPRLGLAVLTILCLGCVFATATCFQQELPPPPPPPPSGVSPRPPTAPHKLPGPAAPQTLPAPAVLDTLPEPAALDIPPQPAIAPLPPAIALEESAELPREQEEFEAQEEALKAQERALSEMKRDQRDRNFERRARQMEDLTKRSKQAAELDARKKIEQLQEMMADMQKRYTAENPDLLAAAVMRQAEALQKEKEWAHSNIPPLVSQADLAELKARGVSVDFVRLMSLVCVSDLRVSAYIDARQHGITLEFLEKVRNHNFENLTLAQLFKLKDSGVL